MAAKVVYTVREEKQGLQKQLGCMNGIFQLLDRGYLPGLHRHWRNQNRLTAGQGENGEKELKKSSEKAKERNQKKMKIEKNRVSVESSRNSTSSSGSSTTFSYLDCSKRVPTAPAPDIRDVVKDSMTRVIRVSKDERASHVMKHVDSPRPFIHQNSIQYDRKDQNLAKIQKTSSEGKRVKEISRSSCDERESKYSLKSTYKVNELPRLSLDSKQNSKNNSMNGPRSEAGRKNRSSSGIVARLMGLDSSTDSICEDETLKVKPAFGDQLGSHSPKVHTKIKPALQQHEGGGRGSITSGKDLRAFKQIVETMQMTKTVFENIKIDQPGSPTVKGTSSPKKHELLSRAVKPVKIATEPVMVTGLHYVDHKARKQVKDLTARNNKVTGTAQRSLEDLTGERPVSCPRLQRSKNGIDKHCINRPSSDSSTIKKQSVLKKRLAKINPVNPVQNNDQPCICSNEPRRLSQDGDTVDSLKSESKQEVTRNNFAEALIEDKPVVELAKLTMEQASPVSVLDAFYLEDTLSPVKKKPNVFKDYDNLCVDETEWNQVGICNLVTRTNAGEFRQTELFNSTGDEITEFPYKSANEDHNYIRDILLASGFLKDPDSAIRVAQLHLTSSIIKPGLFHILEKTNEECHKNNPSSKPNEKIKRKLIFDSVNDILFHKLVMPGFFGKKCVRFVDGEKLLNELWLEIDNLESSAERCIHDEDDGIKVIVSADLNRSSQDWGKYGYEVPVLVQDIERLIFKDLIDEVVNAHAAGVQNRLARHCRRLFSM